MYIILPHRKENAHHVIKVVKPDAGEKGRITVRSFLRRIAVHNVFKGDVLDLTLGNAATFSAQVRNNLPFLNQNKELRP